MTEDSAAPSLRQAIGGRWAVSRPGYLVLLPFFLLGAVMDPIFGSNGMRLVGVLCDTAALAACFGVVLLGADRTVLRRRRLRPVPIALVAGVGALAGALRGVTLEAILVPLGLDGMVVSPRSTWSAMLAGAAGVCLIAYLLDSRERFARARQVLLARLASIESQDAEELEAVRLLRETVHSRGEEVIAGAYTAGRYLITESGSAPDEVRRTASALRAIADGPIRDHSHALWQAQEPSRRLTLAGVLRALASHRPYLEVLAAIPLGFLAIRWVSRQATLTELLLLLTTFAIGVTVVCSVVNAVCARVRALAVPLVVVSPVLLAGTGLAVYAVLSWAGVAPKAAGEMAVTSAFWAGAGVPLANAMRGFSIGRRGLLDDLTRSVTSAERRRGAELAAVGAAQMETARRLHGSVRSDLLALSMRLDAAAATQDPDVIAQAMAEAYRALNTGEALETGPVDAGIRDSLAELAAAWEGLLEVCVAIADDVPEDAALGRRILGVVEDGVADAVRHGGATRVDVAITVAGGCVVITVDDNGASAEAGQPGLGTALLDAGIPNRWERSALPGGGVRLQVRLTLGASPTGAPRSGQS